MTRNDEPADHPAEVAARELLRAAGVCQLAVNLGDPALTRRAARLAHTAARLLAGMVDLPASTDFDDLLATYSNPKDTQPCR